MRLNKRLSKQSWGLWFETLSRPLWRQINDTADFGGYILIVSQGRCGGNRTIHYTGAGAAVGSQKNTHPYDICHDVTYNDRRYGRQSHIYLQMLNFVTPYHRCTKRNGYTNLYICFELLNGVLLSRWYLTNILHAAQHYMCRSTYIYYIYIYTYIFYVCIPTHSCIYKYLRLEYDWFTTPSNMVVIMPSKKVNLISVYCDAM